MSVLLIYPTHENCREIEAEYRDAGITAACYPRRTYATQGDDVQNCWNRDADTAESMGFPVFSTVCSVFPDRRRCQAHGYLSELNAVENADVVLCTHKRAEYTGLKDLTGDRELVSIHEHAIDTLRPPVSITEADLVSVQHVLDRMLNDPRMLDWFGDYMKCDDEGNRYHDEETEVRKERQFDFTHFLVELTDALRCELRQIEKSVPWQPQRTRKIPQGMERTLFFATKIAGARFGGQPWRFLVTAASGDLYSAAILVERRYHKGGGKGQTYLTRRVCGFRNNPPTTKAPVWFNDATMSADRLGTILGRSVRNETPLGQLELQKKAVQIPRDITRRKSGRILCGLLRGILADRPHFRRIGVIGHSVHVPMIESLEPDCRQRIVKVSYFGSGDERSSNEWHRQCDLIVVAGTPRVPPAAIANYLVQIGDVAAACEPAEWNKLFWYGETESGETVKVHGWGYQDDLWRGAHRDLVRAALVQAVGRGRGILESGCEVIVLSTEECGLVLSDTGLEAFGGTSYRVLSALKELTMENPNKRYLGKSIVNSRSIAVATGLSPERVREVLRHFERRGLVQKIGERSGWRPVGPNELIVRE